MTDINRLNQPAELRNAASGGMSGSPSAESEIDLKVIFSQMRQNRSLLFWSVLLGLLIAIMVFVTTPRKYTASTIMMINIEGEEASKQFGDPFKALSLAKKADTIAPAFAVARSTALLERVVDAEKLSEDPEFNKALRDPTWQERGYALVAPVLEAVKGVIGADPGPALGSEEWSKSDMLEWRYAVSELGERVRIYDLEDDLRMKISVTTLDREKSARIANTVAENLNIFLKDSKVTALNSALDWITEEEGRVEGALNEIEAQINAETSTGSVLPGSRALGTNAERLVQGELILESNRRRGEALLRLGEVVARIKGGEDAQSAFATMPDDLRRELINDYLEIFRWERRDEPPSSTQLNNASQIIERALDTQATATTRREQEILPVRAYTRRLSTAQNRYLQLRTNYESNTELLKTLRERLAGLEIERAGGTEKMRVLEIAEPPLLASSPRLKLTLLTGLMGGLMIGAGIVLFRFFKRDAFRSLEDVEKTFNAPAISILSNIQRGLHNRFDWFALPVEIKESYRRAYSAVFVMSDEQKAQALMIASSIPSEGKTTTSLYVAAAAVEEGQKTLVIDMDFRKKSVARYLKIQGKHPHGIYSVFRKEVTLQEAALPFEYGDGFSFDVLTADDRQKSRGSRSRETLSAKPVLDLIEAAKQEYDVIIIDVPPILAVQDASMVGRMVDATLCVVSTRALKKKAARRAVKEWDRANIKLSGLIVRGEKSELHEYYEYGYYHYDYANKGDSRPRRPSQLRRKRRLPGQQSPASGAARE